MRKPGRLVAIETQGVAEFAGNERVRWRRRSWILQVREIFQLIVRRQLVERIVRHQAGDVRLMAGLRQPHLEGGLARLLDLPQPILTGCYLFRIRCQNSLLLGCRQRQCRRRPKVRVIVCAPLVDAVEEGADSVIVGHPDRVVLVVVAARAAPCQRYGPGRKHIRCGTPRECCRLRWSCD